MTTDTRNAGELPDWAAAGDLVIRLRVRNTPHGHLELMDKAAAEIERLVLENWQLKGALGYPVPGDVPQGDFKCGLCDARAIEVAALPTPNTGEAATEDAVRFNDGATKLHPPFEIYHDRIHIGDANGHVCTAENGEIAKVIVSILNAALKETTDNA